MAEKETREWRLAGSVAENYERYLVPVIFYPWAVDLLERIPLSEGDRLLDVGCATGIVTRLAAERLGAGGEAVGIDLLPAMLDAAKTHAPPDARIEWRQASADSLPFEDETFDVVVCQQALQFFPDKGAALREMHRVLAPGGRLAISVWKDLAHIPGYEALADALGRHVGPSPVGFVQMLCALGSSDELRELIESAGFQELRIESVTRDYRVPSVEEFVWQLTQGTPLGANPDVGQSDERTRAAVISDISAKLAPYISEDGVAFPITANVATARK